MWVLEDVDAIYPENSVSIYNRWGGLIFQSEKGKYATTPWNGKYKNDDLPVGTYYFIIENGSNSSDTIKGTVSILRL